MEYRIGEAEVKVRNKNNLLGAMFSAGLAWVVWDGHQRRPEVYNEYALWSVIAFLAFANVINGVRYLIWLKRIKKHYVTVQEGSMTFWEEKTETRLDFDQVSVLLIRTGKKLPDQLVIRLKNGRKIRIQGYDNQNELIDRIKSQFPEDRVQVG